MQHISEYRSEVRVQGVHYYAASKVQFFEGKRLCWRVVFQAKNGDTLTREYRTNRVLKDGNLVIEGTKDE